MGIIKEFKEFILKGNMIDMAVGIVIGAAFGTVVKSLVENIVMPPMGFLMGGVDFAQYSHTLAPAVAAGEEHPVYKNVVEKDIEAVTINYGAFIGDIVELVIVGAAIFVAIKIINSMKRKAEEAPTEAPKPSEDVVLLGEIRDLLSKQNG